MRGWRERRRWTLFVEGLQISTKADGPAALCAAVAEHLDRPVALLPMPLPPQAPCGVVLSMPNRYYIAYDAQTSPLHQRHIVAHELGHLLAGHLAGALSNSELARLLAPELDPKLVAAILGRSGYDERTEWEAEFIAGLLRRQIDTYKGPPGSNDPSSEATVARIWQSLGDGEK